MSLYYLSSEDFSIEKGCLVTNIGGITLVFFHSKKCPHSVRYYPQFKNLPESVRGINFAAVDINDNMAVATLSQKTTTPITSVPKMMLFNNGIPYVEYTGKRDNAAVMAFLTEIVGKLNQRQAFMPTRPPPRQVEAPPQHSQHSQHAPQHMQHAQHHQPQQPQQAPRQNFPPPPPQSGGNSSQGTVQQGPLAGQKFRITPSTQVKEYDSSYGRPYNTASEADYLEMETSYVNNGGARR
jgi:hypothetical protein